MTSAKLSSLELNDQLLFISRGQVDLKTHVSAIDFEIDDDAAIREPGAFTDGPHARSAHRAQDGENAPALRVPGKKDAASCGGARGLDLGTAKRLAAQGSPPDNLTVCDGIARARPGIRRQFEEFGAVEQKCSRDAIFGVDLCGYFSCRRQSRADSEHQTKAHRLSHCSSVAPVRF